MIVVKKDAIKFIDSEGNMQSTGMLCNMGVVENEENDVKNYIMNCNKTFSEAVFPENYTLKWDVPNIGTQGGFGYFIQKSNVYKVILSGNTNKVGHSYDYAFNACSKLVELDVTKFNFIPINGNYTFGSCSKLVNILGEIDFSLFSSACTTMFNATPNLVEIRVKKGTMSQSFKIPSQSLSDASIDSIVNGFVDMTGQDAIVLTVHKDVKAKIEANEAWLATLTSKNVTLA